MNLTAIEKTIQQLHHLYSLQCNDKENYISRAIKQLCQQCKEAYPLIRFPSDWLIEELVANSMKEHIVKNNNWRERIQLTLKQIVYDTQAEDCLYSNQRTHLPLFPNQDLLSVNQVHRTMKVLLSTFNH